MVGLAAAVDIMRKSRHFYLDQFLESLIAGCRVTSFVAGQVYRKRTLAKGVPVIVILTVLRGRYA